MEPKIKKSTTVSKDSFLMIIDMLTESSIRFWVEGGWGVDVLIGKQTREHRDMGDFRCRLYTLSGVLGLLPSLIRGNVFPLPLSPTCIAV